MIINLDQAKELVEMFGGDDAEIVVERVEDSDGHSGPGLYAHLLEYPNEGSVYLGRSDGDGG